MKGKPRHKWKWTHGGTRGRCIKCGLRQRTVRRKRDGRTVDVTERSNDGATWTKASLIMPPCDLSSASLEYVDAKTCTTCGKRIQWETLAGMRLYTRTRRGKTYTTRCGCGRVERDADGRRVTGHR